MSQSIVSFFILSHERPRLLELLLNSMSALFESEYINIILCDNSRHHCHYIQRLTDNFCFTNIYNKPGGSQLDNIYSVLDNLDTPFFCIFHDDDLVHFTDNDVSLLVSSLSNVADKNHLHLINSIGVSEDLSFLSIPKTPLKRPYSLGSLPYSLPFFPAWIYPNSPSVISEFQKLVRREGKYRKTGKYSDVIFLETLLESDNYKYIESPGTYFHIHHRDNDGAAIDLKSKLYLLFLTWIKSKPGQKVEFMFICIVYGVKYFTGWLFSAFYRKSRAIR